MRAQAIADFATTYHRFTGEKSKEDNEDNEENGYYSFKLDYDHEKDKLEIRCIGDLEGNMPTEIKKITNDVLTDERKVIVFTGDLIDRGPKCIRNLLHMFDLKEKKVNKLY